MKKLRNKLLSIFLSVCMLTGMLPIVAFAAGDAFSATSTKLKIGDSVTVSLTQPERVEGAGAVEAVFGFDKEVFEVTNVSSSFSNPNVEVTNVEEANNAGGAGISAIQRDNKMTVPMGMELLSLTLKVKDTAKAGETAFTLDSYEITRTESTTPTVLTPKVNTSITVTIEVQEAEGPTDITDTMQVKFTNKKYPFGERFGKVPETEITVGEVTLTKDTDYTVKGAGKYANNDGWPYVAGNENSKCVVLISPVEGSKYTFTPKEYSFVPESNQDSLTIAYKESLSLSKDYDGKPVVIEMNGHVFSKYETDPMKVMTMTSLRASEGLQSLYLDGSGYTNKVVWTYYTDEACTQKTTTEANGAAAEGGAPVKAGNYWLQAYVAPDNAKIWTEATSNALPFTIRAVEEWNVTIESISDQTYTGEELTPEVTVKNSAGQTLTKDQDYTVSYKNNVNAGTAQVTVKAIEKSENSASKVATAEFKINPAELTAEGLVGTLKPVPYTGKARTPSTPSFTYKGKALTSGTDYTATRTSTEKPVNAGTYSYEWTVTGKGNYTGTANVSVNFVINKKDLSGNSKYPELYPFKNSMTYTGNPITQDQMKVYMTYTDAMVPDVDYTVSYTNNINVGTATITITPKAGGNVIFNEFTAKFEIVDTYNVAPVVEKINSIESPVTLASEQAITEARTAYDKLPDSAKQYVGNYTTLIVAEAKLADLKAADAVDQKIAAIGTVTPASEKAIKDARAAYDALTSEQKALVKNLNTLTAAEAKLKELVNDTTAPIISEIENGKTYYGDTAFSVTELNLDKVTVDGNKVTPDKTTGKYVIPADNQEHTIVAVDKTGNQSECKIKVYKIYTVTFKADDTVLSTQQVGYGKDAELIPTSIIPAKTGYDEIAPKWDKDGKNITADTIITAVYTKNPVGEYTIETPKDNAGSAKLDTTNLKEIEKAVPLTGEEKIQVEQGKDVKLILNVKDVTASVAADDKALVEAQLNGNTLGMYLDVTLFKQLGDAEVTKLTELNKNVVIKFIVPDNLINTNSSINRTYQVIRVHDGKAEVMKSSFDLATKTLSFETDQFSIYALSYSDTLKPVENKVDTEKDDANKDNTNKVTDNQGTTGKGNTGTTYSTTGKVVNTGDSSPIVLLILLMCLAGTVLTGCIYKKKRS